MTDRRVLLILTHRILPASLVIAYFLLQAWRGLFVDFHHDDMMNLYHGWSEPVWRLVLAVIFPFDGVARPLANLLYRAEFLLFGFDAFKYRLTTYVILIADIALVYQVSKLLFHSRYGAYLAAMIFSFHPQMIGIYVNNGTIYDVLGTFWVLLAVMLYLTNRALWKIIVCWLLALGTKEFAAMLPFCLIAIELILWKRESPIPRLRLAILVLMCVVSAGAVKAKSSQGAFLDGEAYKPDLTPHHLGQSIRDETSELIGLTTKKLNNLWSIGIDLTPLLAALIFRRKQFLIVFAMIVGLSIPMWAIPWRGLFVYQVVLVWWAIFAAELIIKSLEFLLRANTPHLRFAAGTLTLLLAATNLLTHWRIPKKDFEGPHYGNQEIRGDLEDYEKLGLKLPRGGSILLLNDRCGTETWTPFFIARLYYHDENLRVDRVKKDQRDASIKYDAVLDLIDGHLTIVSRPAAAD